MRSSSPNIKAYMKKVSLSGCPNSNVSHLRHPGPLEDSPDNGTILCLLLECRPWENVVDLYYTITINSRCIRSKNIACEHTCTACDSNNLFPPQKCRKFCPNHFVDILQQCLSRCFFGSNSSCVLKKHKHFLKFSEV